MKARYYTQTQMDASVIKAVKRGAMEGSRSCLDTMLSCLALYMLDKLALDGETVQRCLDDMERRLTAVADGDISIDDIKETLAREYDVRVNIT